MYTDEDYQKRITYGTPENIKIRRFYNQLNNRPLNYGMEDLFPETPINTMTPLPYNRNTGNYSVPENNNTWQRLGQTFYDEFANDAQLVCLGGENYLNKISNGVYAAYNQNYANRKDNYYNQFAPEWKNLAIKADKTAENIVDLINWRNKIPDLFYANILQRNFAKNNEVSEVMSMLRNQAVKDYQPSHLNIMDTIQKTLYHYGCYPQPITF